MLPWRYCTALRTSGNKASVVHTDEREAKNVKKICHERSSATSCFLNTTQPQKKMRVRYMSQYGTKNTCQITQAWTYHPVLPKYSFQDNSTGTECVSHECKFQDTANYPTAASNIRAIPLGDHSDVGFKSSCIPSP